MDPGKLRHQVTIQAASGSRDGYGHVTQSWSAITGGTNVWAAIEPLSGREALIAQQQQALTTHRITIRHLAGVTPRMRVVFGSRIFNVAGVRNPDERNAWLVLDCVEVV